MRCLERNVLQVIAQRKYQLAVCCGKEEGQAVSRVFVQGKLRLADACRTPNTSEDAVAVRRVALYIHTFLDAIITSNNVYTVSGI